MNLGRGRKGLVEQSQNIPKIQKDKEKQGVQAFCFVSIFPNPKIEKKKPGILYLDTCARANLEEHAAFPSYLVFQLRFVLLAT